MSEFIEITGGVPLQGSVQIGGAKNAILPLMIASLLTPEKCRFRRVPNLEDINIEIHLLENLGAQIEFMGDQVSVQVPRLTACETSYSLVRALRASFWVLGPLLARGGAARVALPGGDIIGARPVDLHLSALARMGADIRVKHGVVYAAAPQGLKGTEIELRFPSVGATHQILMAAALARGTTILRNAAREPEVVALADMLSAMGAGVEGAGTPTIIIRGCAELGGASLDVIGDRIEAATYLLAGALTGGAVKAQGVRPEHLGGFLPVLSELGLEVDTDADSVSVRSNGRLRPVKVSTGPFPEFATDLQAPLMAALTLAEGTSTIEENVFEGRFGHVAELCRMGARIHVEERAATIKGVPRLSGAPVEAHDIRAGAALVIAALAAEGVTSIFEVHHLRRGYETLEGKLSLLGARIGCKLEDPEDFVFTGC